MTKKVLAKCLMVTATVVALAIGVMALTVGESQGECVPYSANIHRCLTGDPNPTAPIYSVRENTDAPYARFIKNSSGVWAPTGFSSDWLNGRSGSGLAGVTFISDPDTPITRTTIGSNGRPAYLDLLDAVEMAAGPETVALTISPLGWQNLDELIIHVGGDSLVKLPDQISGLPYTIVGNLSEITAPGYYILTGTGSGPYFYFGAESQIILRHINNLWEVVVTKDLEFMNGMLLPNRLATGTGGQFLRRNAGNTALEFVDNGSGNLSGPASAMANSVPVFSGTDGKTLTASTVTIGGASFADITAGKYNTVAISGSSTPALTVTGTTTVSGSNNGDSAGHSGLVVLAGTAGGQTIVGGSGATDALSLQGTSGTATGGAAAINFKVGTNGGTTAAWFVNDGSMIFTPAANALKFRLYDSANSKYGMGISTSEMRSYAASTGVQTWGSISTTDGTTYTERMRLTGAGNLGIGNANPTAKLDMSTVLVPTTKDPNAAIRTGTIGSSPGPWYYADTTGPLISFWSATQDWGIGANQWGMYWDTAGKNILWKGGGSSATAHNLNLSTGDGYYKGKVNANSYSLSALNTAPASAIATGTLGEIRVTASYIYVCTATNTWVRAALATW